MILRLGHQSDGKQSGYGQIAKNARIGRIPAVGAQCQQEEQRTEHVFALGNPGHRLNIDGMEREQRRHHQAAPLEARGPPQHQEENEGVQGVQQHVHQVRPGRIKVKELAIQLVRHPGDRMPVRGHRGLHCPFDGGQRQPSLNMAIIDDIVPVVEIQERMMHRWEVQRDGRHQERQAENDGLLAARRQPAFRCRVGAQIRLGSRGSHSSPRGRSSY